MKWNNRVWVVISGFICIFISSISTVESSVVNAESLPTQEIQQQITTQIEQSILDAIANNTVYTQGGLINDLRVTDIEISQDQLWATAWVVYYDPGTGVALPTEPALSVIQYADGEYKVYFPTDPGWEEMVYSLPEDLLSIEEKDMWVAMNQGASQPFPTQSGYYLPWHGGQTGYLSRSVGHDADYTTAHYAFDFYVPGTTVCPNAGGSILGTTGLNFDLYSSKAATVWGWEDTVEDCDHSKVNFIVLRNIDDPSIFQLYLHLAQNSIPDELKSVGTPVARGQFIGRADNTGASTGSHLHFQVEHQPYWPADNPYWSPSLDMTFDDVDINGGRPRVNPLDPPYCRDDDVCDVFRQTYVSNNYYQGDASPPIGDISGISTGDTIAEQTLTLNGWGYDEDSGLNYGQLMANFNGTWHDLGSHFNPDFTYTWNLCNPELAVDNGAVSVALLLYDNAGNPAPLVGLRHFTKAFTCPSPPPICIPDQDQVTLFEDPYYQGGCVIFDIGNYPSPDSLNPLGNDDAESLLIGENVIATLFSDENFSGHSQSFQTDSQFMRYQWVQEDVLSSMMVTSRSSLPQSPLLISPLEGTALREGDVIPFSWFNGGGAVDFQVEIYLESDLVKTITWQSDPVVYVDSLGQGDYSWRVQGRNFGGMSSWSAFNSFSIVSPIVIPQAKTVPYSDTMETTQADWIESNGSIWRYVNNSAMAHSGTHSWWYQSTYGDYDNNLPNSGSLTSPPITIPSIGYYLRFYYRYQTETQGLNWDQRWVQVSVDGEPFTNLVQIYDDPMMPETSSWLRNKAIDLSAFVGHTIRIRFLFSTLDAFGNNFSGWGIDDFSITANPPITCDENREDNSPSQAFLLTYDRNIKMPGDICPNGDYDYYKFFGEAGDRIVVDIDAMIDDSPLDSYLFLLDSDEETVLAENDDEVYAQQRDPLLAYTLAEDGTYFLKLRAWKHPLVGGNDYFYTIRLYEDRIAPIASITYPLSNSFLPDSNMTITTDISDVDHDINRVEFFWHSTNWLPGEWEYLGIDSDGSDGWKITFNPADQPEGINAAFYIKVFDDAGNFTGAGAWNLGIDKTAPITEMNPLSPTQPSNAFLLEWSATDNLSGVDFVEIQEKINNAGWLTLPPVDEIYNNYWIIGIPGNAYSYRMHGIDHSGNSENYPDTAETSTTVPTANVLCFEFDSYDTSGNDNSPANASLIYTNEASQTHNYCNPLAPDYQSDEDWVKFEVVSGQHYLALSEATSPQAATVISLFAQDGTSLLAETEPHKFGGNTALVWTSDRDGMVYARFQHLDERVIGTEVTNTVSVRTGGWTFLPMLHKK